ncbi:MAG: AAA family ATPase [Bacteroidales bacterium]|nr:AAA family ATPase [Bacteroidales bacterium]MCF8352047.1 AAA family ATPase [Bacteroidales bacterium]MCF8375339.1 AAA family ATPase [Bacteroidales bacterium]MCF8400195.1 AAA family ATPase [Bacteroidales bacterium]
MDKLIEYSRLRINSVNTDFKRYLWKEINWNNRLIAITGARGIGKTTLLLQYIKENLAQKPGEVIYVSMDDLYFSKNTLVDFADAFVKRGGKYLFLDEIHKYPNWSQEIKNIYDYFAELKIVITGSSALNIYKGKADLSRRAIMYNMQGMSFREFLELKYKLNFNHLELEEILSNAHEIIPQILDKTKPLKFFEEYLRFGYYPFFVEGEDDFNIRLKQTISHVLETDLPSVENIDYGAVHNIRKLLGILSEIVPYKPNVLSLSEKIGVSRASLLKYLNLLGNADLLMLLLSDTKGISRLNKPEKVYLNNPNLFHALSGGPINKGSIRETYFFNQLNQSHQVTSSRIADFTIDGRYTFEIGGKTKTRKQIKDSTNAFVAADNLEFAFENKIPLWLFGFLY